MSGLSGILIKSILQLIYTATARHNLRDVPGSLWPMTSHSRDALIKVHCCPIDSQSVSPPVSRCAYMGYIIVCAPLSYFTSTCQSATCQSATYQAAIFVPITLRSVQPLSVIYAFLFLSLFLSDTFCLSVSFYLSVSFCLSISPSHSLSLIFMKALSSDYLHPCTPQSVLGCSS